MNYSPIQWTDFFQATKNNLPSQLLIQAIDFCIAKNRALDLGAGALSDTKYLLDKGFEVIAVDSSPLMIEEAKEIDNSNLTAIQSTFTDYKFPKNSFDLVNAQWALPFNPPETFNQMFKKLRGSMKVGAVFAGQFFGKNDEWNTRENKMSFHTKDEVQKLLEGMKILKMTEEENDSKTVTGIMKHWHVYHVIAQVQ